MKKIIALVVVLVLVLVVAPWGIGKLAEQRVNAGLDQIVEQAPYLSIVERNWTRGWFRSEQQVTFEVLGPWARAMNPAAVMEEMEKARASAATAEDATEAGEQPSAEQTPTEQSPALPPLRFTVRNEILHGPVLWPFSLGIARVNSRLELSDALRGKIVEIFGTDEPVRVSSRVGFFGGGTTRLSGDGRKIDFDDKSGSLVYADFRLDIDYSSKLDDIDLDGRWPSLEAVGASNGGSMRMEDMTLVSRNKRIRGDLYDSDFHFGIGEMTVMGADQQKVRMQGVHYALDTSAGDEFLDMAVKVGSGKMENPQLAAIGLDLDEVHFDFTLRRLHIATLEQLTAAFKKAYQQPVMTLADVDKAFVGPLKEYGYKLLEYDPAFMVDGIGIVTPQGEGYIRGVMRLKGATAEDFESGGMGVLAKLEADFTVEVAQKLIETLPNGNSGAGAALDGGYAKREGDKLVSHIEFKNGELTVNGKAQGIPGLGGPPAGARAEE